jgi:hypothetical protein
MADTPYNEPQIPNEDVIQDEESRRILPRLEGIERTMNDGDAPMDRRRKLALQETKLVLQHLDRLDEATRRDVLARLGALGLLEE